MKQTLSLTLLAFIFSMSHAQNITGDWKGNIEINGNNLPIIFHFYKDSSGNNAGNWDSPNQNANKLPFSSIDVNKDSLDLGIKVVSSSYKGKFSGNDSISGVWEQNGLHFPLNFSRTTINDISKEKIVPPYPNEKEMAITYAPGSQLYGTLLSKNKNQKLAIIIAGSGPTDRNGNSPYGATNEYQMLAHSLDSQNIATFRYDKRGVAKSFSPNIRESDLQFVDNVKDAEKIFDYLYDTLGYKQIYFIGHSEGSLVGILASQKKKVKGFISIAGAGRPIDVILQEQMNKQPLPDSVKNQIPAVLDELKKGKTTDNYPKSLEVLFRKSLQPYLISWFKYSPVDEIKKLKCPILILQGACDIQITVADADNLHNANKKSIIDIIPGMTHTLKNAGKDCVNENKTYSDGSMPIDTKLVTDIADFIKRK